MSETSGQTKKFRSYNLADLTYVDVQEYLKEKDTILIPVASMEQQGQHLPIKTDTVTAEEISRRVSKEEYNNIVDEACSLGLNNGWIQKYEAEACDTFLGTKIKQKKEL